jgi:hypothetical protein
MSLLTEGATSVDDDASPKVAGGVGGDAFTNAIARLSSAESDGTSDLSSGSKSGSSSTAVTALGGDGFGLSRDLDQLRLRAFTDSDRIKALPAPGYPSDLAAAAAFVTKNWEPLCGGAGGMLYSLGSGGVCGDGTSLCGGISADSLAIRCAGGG